MLHTPGTLSRGGKYGCCDMLNDSVLFVVKLKKNIALVVYNKVLVHKIYVYTLPF